MNSLKRRTLDSYFLPRKLLKSADCVVVGRLLRVRGMCDHGAVAAKSNQRSYFFYYLLLIWLTGVI